MDDKRTGRQYIWVMEGARLGVAFSLAFPTQSQTFHVLLPIPLLYSKIPLAFLSVIDPGAKLSFFARLFFSLLSYLTLTNPRRPQDLNTLTLHPKLRAQGPERHGLACFD